MVVAAAAAQLLAAVAAEEVAEMRPPKRRRRPRGAQSLLRLLDMNGGFRSECVLQRVSERLPVHMRGSKHGVRLRKPGVLRHLIETNPIIDSPCTSCTHQVISPALA